jgi:hypothetical protein
MVEKLNDHALRMVEDAATRVRTIGKEKYTAELSLHMTSVLGELGIMFGDDWMHIMLDEMARNFRHVTFDPAHQAFELVVNTYDSLASLAEVK